MMFTAVRPASSLLPKLHSRWQPTARVSRHHSQGGLGNDFVLARDGKKQAGIAVGFPALAEAVDVFAMQQRVNRVFLGIPIRRLAGALADVVDFRAWDSTVTRLLPFNSRASIIFWPNWVVETLLKEE